MQKNMTDMEDKETFAHSPRAPGPLLSVIPLSSLLLWAEAPDAVARLTRGWADAPPACPASAPPCSEREATFSYHIPHALPILLQVALHNAPGVKCPNTANLECHQMELVDGITG